MQFKEKRNVIDIFYENYFSHSLYWSRAVSGTCVGTPVSGTCSRSSFCKWRTDRVCFSVTPGMAVSMREN